MGNPTEALTLGQKVLNYAKGKLGQKVDRGECWDLAENALNTAGAKNSNDLTNSADFAKQRYVWGKEVKLADAQPGDIVQVNDLSITVRRTQSDGAWRENTNNAPYHTMVVKSAMNAEGATGVYEQNFKNVKKVTTGTYHLVSKSWTEGTAPNTTKVTVTVKGRIKVYRAIKK